MDLWEWFFLIQFITLLGLTGLKMFNIIRLGTLYSWFGIFGGWIGALLSWGFGFGLFIQFSATNPFLVILFKGENLFIIINTFFFIVEILFMLNVVAQENIGTRGRFNSMEQRLKDKLDY